MLKVILGAATVLATTAITATAGTIVLPVGPSQQFTTIAAAVNAANGDTNPADYYVISVLPGTYTNDTAIVTRPMTIQNAQPGATVLLNETVDLPNQKGILDTYAALTVDGLTFQGAHISDGLGANGAGIRAEGSSEYTLTVQNSQFISNQTGILTDVNFPLDVVLTNNVFINNGNGNLSSLTHGIYIATGNNSLTAIGNEFCGTIVGHDIKSRAMTNTIQNNTLYDGAPDPNQPLCTAGSTSYALDIPNGGVALVTGNLIIQGTTTQNPAMVAYGEEGLTYPTNSFVFSKNTLQNTLPGGYGILDPNGVPVTGSGNVFDPSITQPVSPPSANQLTGSNAGGGGSSSPDGTILTAPSTGSLTTAAGTWTFSTTQQQPGQYVILLNGNYVSGWGAEMEVNHGGQMYAYNSVYLGGSWWLWTGGSWSQSAAP